MSGREKQSGYMGIKVYEIERPFSGVLLKLPTADFRYFDYRVFQVEEKVMIQTGYHHTIATGVRIG